MPAAAETPWEPFPATTPTNDFGGVGLIQTPTARFAPDGQVTFGINHVQPYDRYFFTVQGLPWLEATLRLTTVRNRLYSPFPEFSGTQSYKDRGFDLKIKMIEEGGIRPALAFGLRDFVGTGLFSSEYFVLNKSSGPIDVSLGVAWGNLASRGLVKNPFTLLSDRFRDRGTYTAGGGTVSGSYFKGREVALFGGVKYDTPLKGVTIKAEYDSNNYKDEALNNRFRVRLPVNVGVDYAPRSWLHLAAGLERGNKIGLTATLTNNFNRSFRVPKFDPPPDPITEPEKQIAAAKTAAAEAAPDPQAATAVTEVDATAAAKPSSAEDKDLHRLLTNVLAIQGTGLYSADFQPHEVTLYIGQSRFRNMAMGLGRIARAAFSVLPDNIKAIRVVFVENGVQTLAVRLYRDSFIAALTPGRGSPEELLARTEFSESPMGLSDATYQAPLSRRSPHFFYSIRPLLKTTLGRPEQFVLYELGAKLNAFLQISRGFNVTGSLALNFADNFDKMRIPSDSQLPHVRSDIKEYLRQGKTSISQLQANYSFNITDSLYGHVYAGLLEEMFGGVGGEVLYRQATQNWAVGADLTYVKQRDFDQMFDFRKYSTMTGFLTGAYFFPGSNIDVRVRLGRYLAKDYGGTFEISRTFDSGVVIGAFATKTNVSAERFGEGRFDKGIYFSIPLDAIYVRHVRGNVGLAYRPLIRDGGQMLQMPQPLLITTDETLASKFRRDWGQIGQ